MLSHLEDIAEEGSWASVWLTTSWYAIFSVVVNLRLTSSIQGSGFIAYGIIMALILIVGEAWMKRSGRSPEFWDSLIILIWVCVSYVDGLLGTHWRFIGN